MHILSLMGHDDLKCLKIKDNRLFSCFFPLTLSRTKGAARSPFLKNFFPRTGLHSCFSFPGKYVVRIIMAAQFRLSLFVRISQYLLRLYYLSRNHCTPVRFQNNNKKKTGHSCTCVAIFWGEGGKVIWQCKVNLHKTAFSTPAVGIIHLVCMQLAVKGQLGLYARYT